MVSTCRLCQSAFETSKDDLAFLEKISPTFAGKKERIPPPTLCPDCRQQRRLLWRNEYCLYRRSCDLCKKSIISQYSTDKPFTVYCHECWWSDRWDPLSFGQPYDFSRPFFDQFRALQIQVPRMALNAVVNENSQYVHLSGYNKNCYLLFAAEYCEDCHYGNQVVKSLGCMDAFNCLESRYCYEVTDVEKSHDLLFSESCSNCSTSMFLFDCKGCADCLLCTNLRKKTNMVRNKQCTPEEFKREREALMMRISKGELPQIKDEFEQLKAQSIHRAQEAVNCEAATGDYLKNCKNVRHCFDLSYGEDCSNVYTGFHVKDLMDVCHTTDAELGYNGISFGYGSYNAICTHGSWSGKNLLYCDTVQAGCTDLFGCVMVKKQQHCILNKQHSKEEYERLVSKIIDHMRSTNEWGLFFSPACAPFGYNETTANIYFPLSCEESHAQGFPWKDGEEEVPTVSKVINAADLSSDIGEIPDDILGWAITCEATKRPFRIVKQELQFYRDRGLSIPHFHPDERHRRRMALRNPRQIWRRTCMKCGKGIETTYSSDRKEKVYCEECYLKEVY